MVTVTKAPHIDTLFTTEGTSLDEKDEPDVRTLSVKTLTPYVNI
jgi:hypothetical protein